MVDQPAEPRAEDRPYHVSDAVSDQGPDGPADETVGQRTRWERIRLNILRVVAVIGAFVFIIGVLTACAGIYTSRPEFCRSCHNMEPYYASWKHSSHSHVSCIKCHFPPGAGEKIRGKMLGLVQLVKYVTSSEGPRPSAEVPDASCLRSGCHETRLLSGRVDFNGIPFDHRPHLNQARRGKKLRCTSCHSQIVQGSHMTVTQSTCFLCHFKEQQFNQGLGTCTRCHQIPEEKFDLGGGVTFDHEMVYQRNTDCKNCHGDLIKGNGQVPPERCTVLSQPGRRSREDWRLGIPASDARLRPQGRLSGMPFRDPPFARPTAHRACRFELRFLSPRSSPGPGEYAQGHWSPHDGDRVECDGCGPFDMPLLSPGQVRIRQRIGDLEGVHSGLLPMSRCDHCRSTMGDE